MLYNHTVIIPKRNTYADYLLLSASKGQAIASLKDILQCLLAHVRLLHKFKRILYACSGHFVVPEARPQGRSLSIEHLRPSPQN